MFSIFAVGSIQHRRRGISTLLLRAAGLLVALMIGFRYEVGGDWFNYTNMLERVRFDDLAAVLQRADPGYMLLNWIAIQIGADIWFVNLLSGLIFTWGLVRLARHQPNPWLACLVAVPYLVIVVAMGYTRQGIAIGVIMAGLAVLGRSSLVKFCIYIFIAAAFHKSALIVLPLVGLAWSHNRVISLAFLGLAGAIIYYLFLESSIDTLVVNYVGAEYESQGAAIRVAMNIPPAAIFLKFQSRFLIDAKQKRSWRNFAWASFLALIVLVFSGSATTAVDRIALYLIPLQLFVLSWLPFAFARRDGRPNQQVLLGVILYSALVQFVWLNFAAHSDHWLPYRLFPLL